MNIYKKQSMSDALKVYLDKRMIKILLLGAISGFPWVIIGSSLSLWLKEDGLSRSTIGWAGLIFAVYAFNYLWAPLIDRIKIPWLTSKVGHRRGWIITMQTLILICLVLEFNKSISKFSIGNQHRTYNSYSFATQDITVDALRIEQIGENEGKAMQAGAAMSVVGWWTGYKLGGLVALNTAEFFQQAGIENYWQVTFLILGILIIGCNIGLMYVNEQHPGDREEIQKRTDKTIEDKFSSSNILTKIVSWLTGTIIGPVISFFKKMALI